MNCIHDHSSERLYSSLSSIMKMFKSIIISLQNAAKSMANYCFEEYKLNKISHQIQEMEQQASSIYNSQLNYNIPEHRKIQKRLLSRLLEILNLYENKNQHTFGMLVMSSLFIELRLLISQYDEQNLRMGKLVSAKCRVFKKYLQNLSTHVDYILGRPTVQKIKHAKAEKLPEPFNNKRLFKYKLTKQIKNNFQLYGNALNLDYEHLKSIVFQSRNNSSELQTLFLSNNDTASRQRQMYRKNYDDWKEKMLKKKKSKREKAKTSISPEKNDENIENRKYLRKLSIQKPMLKLNQNKLQIKKVEWDKTFVNLKQVRNCKNRQPYTQIKQVLVSGDELNYYSSKNNTKNINLVTCNRKASYFMTRGIKLDKQKFLNTTHKLMTQ